MYITLLIVLAILAFWIVVLIKTIQQKKKEDIKDTKNMKKKSTINTFVAVDFETMTKNPASICAAGFVKVVNGVIHEQWYSLIKPVEDDMPETFTWLHGITYEMTASAPTYPTAHAKLREMLSDGSPFVCHWTGADVRFAEAAQEHYSLNNCINETVDTYELSGMNLANACEYYGIDLGNHHDALCDARACAQLFLALQGLPITPPKPKRRGKFDEMTEVRHIDKHTLSVPTEDEISDKSTIFYHSNCVITGTFTAYPKREELAKILRDLGADINTAISGKTTLVVAGNGFGPKKMADIEKRQAAGQPITLIDEGKLMTILKQAGRA